MKRKINLILPIIVVVCFFVTGCGHKNESVLLTGNSVNIPERIICVSPVMTEIVFALGGGGRVVGISSYTTYPAEALTLPEVGTAFTPNKETMLSLKPDLIIGQGKQQSIREFGKRYNIRVVSLKMDTMEDVYSSIREIADILQVPEHGKDLIDNISQQISVVHKQISNLPPRKVLVLFGRTPGKITSLTTIGPGSFLGELITEAGGSNIFNDARGPYPQVSFESLLARRPEVVLELYPEGIDGKKKDALRKDWKSFSSIPAVRNNNIYYMTNNYLLIPGPRMGMSIKRFAEKIHPEAF